MKIRRIRGLTGAEIGLATILGVLGGIYIWKPIFTQQKITSVTNNGENKGTNK